MNTPIYFEPLIFIPKIKKFIVKKINAILSNHEIFCDIYIVSFTVKCGDFKL